MNYVFTMIAAGLAATVVAAQSLGMFGGGAPSIWSPMPIILVLPIFIGLPPIAALAVFAILFWAWHPALMRGSTVVPIRTVLLLSVAGTFSLIWFVTGWGFGIRYQGLRYSVVCAILSAVMLVVSIALIVRARTAPSFVRTLATHFSLFAWLSSYAFSYLGETP